MPKSKSTKSKTSKDNKNVLFESTNKKEPIKKTGTKKKDNSTVVLKVDPDVVKELKHADNLVISEDADLKTKVDSNVKEENTSEQIKPEEIKKEEIKPEEIKDEVKEDKPKKKKTALIIALIIGFLVIGGLGAGLGIYFGTRKPVTYDESKELINDEFYSVVKDNVDISNTTVEVGKDFDTTLSIKDGSKENYCFDDDSIKVYTLKPSSSNSKNSNGDVKAALTKDKDYTIKYSGDNYSVAILKVFSSSFNNKIFLDVKMVAKTYNDLVIWDDETVPYDNAEHTFEYTVKEGRTIPNGTSISYTYEGVTKSTPFKFKDEGDYRITLTLNPKEGKVIKGYEKTVTKKITKEEIPQEAKDKIKFTNTTIRKGTAQGVTFENLNNEPIYELYSEPYVQYYVNNTWTTVVPQDLGSYQIKVDFIFKNFVKYELIDACTVVPYAKLKIAFDVKSNKGFWDDTLTQNETRESKEIDITKDHTPFYDFKKSAGVDKITPKREGHKFDGWFRIEGGKEVEVDDYDLINDEQAFTVFAKFSEKEYQLTFSYVKATNIKYSVYVDGNPIEVIENKAYVKYGHKVNVKVTEFNEELYNLTGVYVDSKTYKFKQNDNYWILEEPFIMPAYDPVAIIYAPGKTKGIGYYFLSDRVEVSEGDIVTEGNKQIAKFKYKNLSDYSVTQIYYMSDNHSAMTSNIVDNGSGLESERAWSTCTFPDDDIYGYVVFVSIANQHNLQFDGVLKDAVVPESFNTYFGLSLTYVTDGLTADHPYGAFRGWSKDPDSDDLITETDTMPSSDYKLYASWYKYNFVFIDGEHGSVTGDTTITNQVYLTSDVLNNITVTPYEGHKFIKWFKVYDYDLIKEEKTFLLETDFSSPLAPGVLGDKSIKEDGHTLLIEPIYNVLNYPIAFNDNGGFVKNSGYLSSGNYGMSLLTAINNQNIKATHEYAEFSAWNYHYNGNDYLIDNNSTMPAGAITIKPLWKTYYFMFVDTDHCKLPTGGKYEYRGIECYGDDFKYNVDEGYLIDYMEYSYDNGQTWNKHAINAPIRPYIDTAGKQSQNDEILVRMHTVSSFVDIIFFANGGSFNVTSGGLTSYKVLTVLEGTTWREIKKSMPRPTPPSQSGTYFDRYVYEDGSEINDDDIFDKTKVLVAQYQKWSST